MIARMSIKSLYGHLSPVDGVAHTAHGFEVSQNGRYFDLRDPKTGVLLSSDGETCSVERAEDGSFRCSSLGETFILSAKEFEVAATSLDG